MSSITELDLTNNPEMKYLFIQFLDLKELDISNCEKLINLVENYEQDEIDDRQSWDGFYDDAGQMMVPLKCKLIY